MLIKAFKFTPITFHSNKGLSGASKDAIKREKDTSLNPTVLDAAALVILNAGTNEKFYDIRTSRPTNKEAQEAIDRISQAMKLLVEITPKAGTYSSEAYYFQKEWQNDFWGSNYAKSLEIKQKYDPESLFICHHCVGSEIWDSQGNCKIRKLP